MATKKSTRITPAQLWDAFKTDLANCWQQAGSLHPKETASEPITLWRIPG